MDCCAPLSFLPQSRPLDAKGQGNVLEDLRLSPKPLLTDRNPIRIFTNVSWQRLSLAPNTLTKVG